jgi:ribosome-binding factor A
VEVGSEGLNQEKLEVGLAFERRPGSRFELTSDFHFPLQTSNFPTSDFKRQISNFQVSALSPTMASPRSGRVGEQIREDLSVLLAREVHDPGIGFLTITRVQVTADLQNARVYYTTLGDATARTQTSRALDRATPFLRRQLGRRLQLRRVPELQFFFDESVEKLDRVERILQEIQAERAATAPGDHGAPEPDAVPSAIPDSINEHDDDR